MHTRPFTPQTIDPLTATAALLVKLQSPTAEKKLDPERVRRELRVQEDSLIQGDLSYLEAMLGAQAQLLHGMFAGATERYAERAPEEHTKFYAGVALKAQHYCRLTVAAIARLKKPAPAARPYVPVEMSPEEEQAVRPNGVSDVAWVEMKKGILARRAAAGRPPAHTKPPGANAEEWIEIMRRRAGFTDENDPYRR